MDAFISSRTIRAFGTGLGAAIDAIEVDAEVREAISGLATPFLSNLKFSALSVFACAIIVFAVAADLRSARINGGIVVVAILKPLASAADAVAIAVFIDAIGGIGGGAIVVHLTVTIIVKAIAADIFGGRLHFTAARTPLTERAGLCPSCADPNSLCSRWACVAFSRLAIVARSGACAAFIGLTIAIVVDLVAAGLRGCGEDLAEAWAPDANLASLLTALTATDAICIGGSCVAIAREVFINLAVAVIVFAIADLCASTACILTNDLPAFALVGAAATVGGASAPASRVSFINLAIAIVVSPVAGFCRRFNFAATSAPSAAATALRAIFAQTLSSRTARTCVTSARLAACAFGRGPPTVATIGITSRDPSCDVVVSDAIPSCRGAANA